jgi:hypothetical protein
VCYLSTKKGTHLLTKNQTNDSHLPKHEAGPCCSKTHSIWEFCYFSTVYILKKGGIRIFSTVCQQGYTSNTALMLSPSLSLSLFSLSLSLSLSLSNRATAQDCPQPPLRVSSILPCLGRLLRSFYILASLHLPPLHLPNAVWVSLWDAFLLAH